MISEWTPGFFDKNHLIEWFSICFVLSVLFDAFTALALNYTPFGITGVGLSVAATALVLGTVLGRLIVSKLTGKDQAVNMMPNLSSSGGEVAAIGCHAVRGWVPAAVGSGVVLFLALFSLWAMPLVANTAAHVDALISPHTETGYASLTVACRQLRGRLGYELTYSAVDKGDRYKRYRLLVESASYPILDVGLPNYLGREHAVSRALIVDRSWLRSGAWLIRGRRRSPDASSLWTTIGRAACTTHG
jgi:hypothetical protein